MNENNIKKLNVFTIPLKNINLIEASAGTGKTFTIVLLFLRLLLGIGEKKTYSKKLLVHEILIVTFTNAAKEELYVRIKNSINNLYIACINKSRNDSFSQLFLQEINDLEEASILLKQAQNNIHHISIYTIHSFCQKILQSHTFPFHSIFKEKIIENENKLYLKATQDFWRRYFYDLPENIVQMIYQHFNSPESLLKKIKPFLHLRSIDFQKKIKKNSLVFWHEKNIEKINSFKKDWMIYHSIMFQKIAILNLNKKIYNKFNILRWINDITIWAKSFTQDYMIPVSLKYFSKENIQKNTLNKTDLNEIIFEKTEKILKENFSLKNILILNAIKNIPKFVKKEKEKKYLLGFDDLLNIFLKTIKKQKFLRDLIRKKYPVAFIDEFQDTDLEQYKIFKLIYEKNKKTALFLIGDPKQAIYSFRGADIFSYLHVKSKIRKYYYLDTNWRSSINMCKSINLLFSQSKYPFIFEKIPFIPINPSLKNSKMNFTVKRISQTPISFFLQEEKNVSLENYQTWISKTCANEISYWLSCSKKEEAIITTKNGERILKSNDIAILVRNKKEANLIQTELNKKNIVSTYSSSKTSVFNTSDAKELLHILKTILDPTNETLLKQSSCSDILKKLFSIEKRKVNNKDSFFVIEKLYQYYNIWKKIGVFCMIKKIVLDYQKNFNFLQKKIDYQKNFNFLHIGELLEEKYQHFYKKRFLISWFEKKILKNKEFVSSEHVRDLDNLQAVKIITIHKSKGLEYPIVWIPFIIDFKQSKNFIYHDKKNFKIFFDMEQKNESLMISEEERLAEDLRFLYVAITRATLHCSIGIACLTKKKIKNRTYSDLHHSSLGYIIQNGKKMNYENLYNKLYKLSNNNLIEIKNKTLNLKSSINIKKEVIYLIDTGDFLNKKIKNTWNITSFTELNKENKLLINNKNKTTLRDVLMEKKTKKKLTMHNFPRGKQTGLLMHYILNYVNFTNQKNYDWLSNVLQRYNISLKWTSMLQFWTQNILNTPLNKKKIILSKLKKESYIRELDFWLPIKNILNSQQLNNIVQSFDSISIRSPELFFKPTQGILKGFIDLVFFWDHKYYIIDYKSNWLGKDNNFYSSEQIEQEMIKNRYDLQYQLYTVAIHRYLQKKLKNYHYKKDFGGVFYIFLRAMSNEKNSGIFYTTPCYSLIQELTTLIK